MRKLCEWKGVDIIEAEACSDHIHMLVQIPPKISVSSFMGYLDHMEMTEADDNIKLPEDTEFNDEEIVLTLGGEKLTIEDGTDTMDIDISELI